MVKGSHYNGLINGDVLAVRKVGLDDHEILDFICLRCGSESITRIERQALVLLWHDAVAIADLRAGECDTILW